MGDSMAWALLDDARTQISGVADTLGLLGYLQANDLLNDVAGQNAAQYIYNGMVRTLREVDAALDKVMDGMRDGE